MNKKRKVPDQSRRTFFKQSTLAGAGLATAAVLPGAALATPDDKAAATDKQKGYQLTQHVIDYYKSAAS